MTWSFRTNGDFIDLIHIDNTSLHSELLVKSLHNTSRSVYWSLTEDESVITFIVDGSRFENVSITEIDFNGTPMDSQDDFETEITELFPGLQGGGDSGDPSYLVYVALISQSDTDAPTVDAELENTFNSEFTYSYISPGRYRISNVDIRSTFNGALGNSDLFKTPIEIRKYI